MMDNSIRLVGRVATLREFALADSEDLLAIYGDPLATAHLSFEARSPQQVDVIIESAIESAVSEPREVYMLAAVANSDSTLVGAARLALGEYQSAQIGFAIRPDRWGTGFGLDTVRLLQQLGFDVLGLHRIWGARSPDNEASARTMAKAGMVEEGTIRDHLFTRGRWRDSVVHSILAHEYMKFGVSAAPAFD